MKCKVSFYPKDDQTVVTYTIKAESLKGLIKAIENKSVVGEFGAVTLDNLCKLEIIKEK